MKFLKLLICVAYLVTAVVVAVNSKHAGEKKSSMAMAKPTSAPLITSTLAPTKDSKVHVSPTKPTVLAKSSSISQSQNTTSALANEEETKKNKQQILPLEIPPTVVTPQITPKVQPLMVTGFITKNGSIYEVTDKNGIGKIEGRQATEANDDTTSEYVCNYGAVLIYSDVPCDKVTSVKVKEHGEQPALDQQKPNQPADNKETEDKGEADSANKPDVRRRPNKKRGNKNKNRQGQQKQKQKQQKNKNRQNQNNQIRTGINNNSSNNRRRLQNQQQRQKQRKQEQNRRRQQQLQQNRRKWPSTEDYDNDADDERHLYENPRQDQRRKQQAQRFTLDYDDY